MSAAVASSLKLIFDQGELAHRTLKGFYPLTSKLNTPAQLAKHERRRRVLQRVAEAGHTREQPPARDSPAVLKDRYYIPKLSYNNPLYIFSFLRDHENDPAVTVSLALFLVQVTHDFVRGSYQSSRTTYYTDFET
jgi:hypothetical protein